MFVLKKCDFLPNDINGGKNEIGTKISNEHIVYISSERKVCLCYIFYILKCTMFFSICNLPSMEKVATVICQKTGIQSSERHRENYYNM